MVRDSDLHIEFTAKFQHRSQTDYPSNLVFFNYPIVNALTQKKMSHLRSEYEDKRLKKNAFSDRLLKMELERLDSQREQAAKQFKQEKGQLRRQLAEGEQIIKLKCLDPENIRPLSSVDLKKLSPGFSRKLSTPCCMPQAAGSTSLPQISCSGVASSDMKFNSKTSPQVESRQKRVALRRSSLPPIITVHECIEYGCKDGDSAKDGDSTKRSDINGVKLLQRRRSTNTPKTTGAGFSGRINEFLEKLKVETGERKEIEHKK